MALTPRHLRSISEHTARESGHIIDDDASHALECLYVERDAERTVLAAVRRPGALVLEGNAGSGKTSTLWHVHRRALAAQRTTYLFRADFVAAQDVDALLAALRAPVTQSAPPLLIIDTVDAVLSASGSRQVLLDLTSGATDAGWAVLLGCRPGEAGRYLPGIDRKYLGDSYTDREFTLSVESHARHFYRRPDLDSTSAHVQAILSAVAHGHPIADVARNPLLLRMLFSLYAPLQVPDDINASSLYNAFFDRRVRTDWRAGRVDPEAGASDCSRIAYELALRMIAEGVLQLSLDDLYGPMSDDAALIKQLVGRGVLRMTSDGLRLRSAEFFHQSFLEYTAARGLVHNYGSAGLNMLIGHLRQDVADYFRRPVLDHAFAVIATTGLARSVDSEACVQGVLSGDAAWLYPAGIIGFVHIRNPTPSLVELVERRLAAGMVTDALLKCLAALSEARWADVWCWLATIWRCGVAAGGAKQHSTRRGVIEQLARLSQRNAATAMAAADFVDDHGVIFAAPAPDEAHLVARMLAGIATFAPHRALAQLQEYFDFLTAHCPANTQAASTVVLAMTGIPGGVSTAERAMNLLHAGRRPTRLDRVRAALVSAIWSEAQLGWPEISSSITSSAFDGPAVAAWLSTRDDSDVDAAWQTFVAIDDAALQVDWVRTVWDRVALHPSDPEGTPSLRAGRLIARLTAGSYASGDSTRAWQATLAFFQQSRSFFLREESLKHLLDQRPDLADLASFSDSGRLGLLLGPALTLDIAAAWQVVTTGTEDANTRERLVADVADIAARAPGRAGALVAFVLRIGEFARLEPILAIDDLNLSALPFTLEDRAAATQFILAQFDGTRGKGATKRQQLGARWATLAYERGLTLELTSDAVLDLIAQCAHDAKTHGWLAILLCRVATSDFDVLRAWPEVVKAAMADEHVRDKVYERLVELAVLRAPSRLPEVLKLAFVPSPNIRRVRAFFWALPTIAVTDRNTADLLACEALIAPNCLPSMRPTQLLSLAIEVRKPLIRWSSGASTEVIQRLVAAIPEIPALVALLILDFALRPPHREVQLGRVAHLAQDASLDEELRTRAAKLIHLRAARMEVAAWAILKDHIEWDRRRNDVRKGPMDELDSNAVRFFASSYPRFASRAAHWVMCGGSEAEVPDIDDPVAAWTHMWRRAQSGATVTPEALVAVGLRSYPKATPLLAWSVNRAHPGVVGAAAATVGALARGDSPADVMQRLATELDALPDVSEYLVEVAGHAVAVSAPPAEVVAAHPALRAVHETLLSGALGAWKATVEAGVKALIEVLLRVPPM